MDLHEHLFRHEAGRMTASLVRLFGIHNLALVEDVVQDAFCRALEVWPRRGVPPNPSAWLMTTARNRAIDVIRRERTARTFAPDVTRLLETEWTAMAVVDEAFTAPVVRDEQLRMMFTCCHPDLSQPVQVALILNVLCGFGAPEIAAAFLSGRAAIEKRISRGKQTLAASRVFNLRNEDFASRLDAVHHALYLLFNEGYHGASARGSVRAELCNEATRLVHLLAEGSVTATPATLALAALMELHLARVASRVDSAGELAAFANQDRGKWDRKRIARGRALLEDSSSGDAISPFHIEAAIALVHCDAPTGEATDWDAIVSLYDRLMTIAPSPVVALNRAVAIGERDGPDAGIAAMAPLDGDPHLAAYPFHPAARAELEWRRGHTADAVVQLQRAIALARNTSERRFLERRLKQMQNGSPGAAL